MIDTARLTIERAVLARKLPANTYHFCDMDGPSPFLAVAARTNRGNLYTVHIDLDEFPDSIPAAYITKELRDRRGRLLDSADGSMHVLPSDNSWTRICHYGYESWTPTVSLYKVFIKCRLWLEMYELHLQTGKPIDYYLKHQA